MYVTPPNHIGLVSGLENSFSRDNTVDFWGLESKKLELKKNMAESEKRTGVIEAIKSQKSQKKNSNRE